MIMIEPSVVRVKYRWLAGVLLNYRVPCMIMWMKSSFVTVLENKSAAVEKCPGHRHSSFSPLAASFSPSATAAVEMFSE